jgi:predicted MFS family arabinose efflux permease
MPASTKLVVILVLGTTQTLAWASTYYLPAILADRIADAVGTSGTWFFAAFSTSLIVSALVGPWAGRTVDAIGGREVLAVSNVTIALGLTALALAHGQVTLWIAWLMLGVGMGIGLYDTAFAALGRIYGTEARSAITGITLIAGFASTLGWPLTAWGARGLGWRETCLAWAAANLLVALPLNLLFLPRSRRPAAAAAEHKAPVRVDRCMVVLGFAFAVSWMVVAAMAVHLPRLLEAAGASSVQAIAAGALIGPAQVAARIAEAGLLKRFHPMLSARISVALHPIGAAILGCFGAAAACGAFTVLHGAGSGILTIARGTLPLALFGPANYGYRLGLLGAPSRVAMALAPVLFAILIERFGAGSLLFSSGLDIAALLALCMLPNPAAPPTGR